MLLSKLLGERYKEKPVEAMTQSHIYLLRGGYVRQVTAGIFSLLPPAKKITQKIEAIIREEMDAIDGQEVLFPVVMPRELWDESGRFESVGKELMRIKDRNGRDMLLGMTHEEAAVHLARSEVKTYVKYPFMIYQIQTKFRDEARPRAGLIRTREFTMKDAYSFHTSQEDLEKYYDICLDAYHRICKRVGLNDVVAVKSDTGMMGGSVAHEFIFLCDSGEDSIVLCSDLSCGYAANIEACEVQVENTQSDAQETKEKISTPGVKTIDALSEHLGLSADKFVKAAVFAVEGRKKPLIVFIRGDYEVNETKLRNAVGAEVFPLTNLSDYDIEFGFIGPCGLKTAELDVLFDKTLANAVNMVCGGNERDVHFKGVSINRDVKVNEFFDIAKINEGDKCPQCGKPVAIKRGVEVGNIFQLGQKYTKSMNMTYMNAQGELEHPIMGCYGIGVGRLLACVAEQCNDDYGIIWPKSIAPWDIHICVFGGKDETVKNTAFDIYNSLRNNYDTLLDDREVGTGVQLADADLLGVPIRLIVSKRNVANGEVEVVSRDKAFKELVKLDALEDFLKELSQRI